MQENHSMLLSKKEDDYIYLAAYLDFKAENFKDASWLKHVAEGKDPDKVLKEILIAIFQSLALAKDLLETSSSEELFLKNLEQLTYLSKKEVKSNRGSPQCIFHRCKTFVPSTLDTPEEPIPFRINLDVHNPAEYEKAEGDKDIIKLNIDLAQLAVSSLGRIEIYFNSYVITEVVRAVCAKSEKPFAEVLAGSGKFRNIYKFAKDLNMLHINLAPNVFDKEKFIKYENLFADKKIKKNAAITDLQRFLFYAEIQQNPRSLHYLEKLFIQLLGHYDFDVRDKSIVCLNMLYDGVDWQFGAAFEPKVTSVDSPFVISETILSKTPPNYIVLLLSAPAFYKDSTVTTFSWHPLEVISSDPIKGEYAVKAKFKKFWRCGFYDWKLVEIDPNGRIEMLKKPHPEDGQTFAQGRFIVHPKDINEQQIHEVVVDYKDQDTDPDKNFYTLAEELPNYSSMGINCLYLMGTMERDNGVSVDESTGEVIEVKRPGASPLAVIDRATTSRMLGGEKGYQKLMAVAKKTKMRILVDCLARVSSARPHRKYVKVLLHTMDAEGKRTLCYGADGRSVHYEDTAMLNYRKLRTWNMLVEDAVRVAEKYGVNGVHLDNAQVWPAILELDDEELYRKDPDGVSAYTVKQILDGEVVRQYEGQGYWDSDNLVKYANPIFVKLCRELWARFPDFLIIGECLGGASLENRQGILARSGVIPRLFKLPAALASLFGKKLLKDGRVIGCKPDTVTALKNWYEGNRRFTPDGSYLIQSSSSHIWPYPGLLYGRGAWSAVDVLFFMPDIPMTFMGEIFGHVYRRNIASVYQAKPLPKQSIQRPKSQLHLAMEEQEGEADEETKKPAKKEEHAPLEDRSKAMPRVKSMVSLSAVPSGAEAKKKEEEITKQLGPQYGFDLKKIHLHYEHRRRLRQEKPVLRYGQLVMLEAKHSEGWHPHVLAFARFSHSETAVVAINFTDRDVSFYVDMTNLLPLFQKHYPPNVVVLFSDWFTDKEKDYYFLNELINEKIQFTLKPFSSLCRGIVTCDNDPYAYAVALEKSAVRISTKMLKGMDCSTSQLCSQLIESLAKNHSLNDFAMRLAAVQKLYAAPNKFTLHSLFVNTFVPSNDTKNAGRCIEYCKKLLQYSAKAPNLASVKASQEIVSTNKLGPIVFVTPEISRWSTVGGLGVMVDELTQGLAEINEDVHVIAVYYDRNRKGETGYLAKDPAGFTYKKNVSVKAAGATYSLGVHAAVVNRVKVVFLHNAELYPTAYPDWNAAMTLRQIVVFCKGALEYLCSEGLIPAVVVTNDWFTALTAAYNKSGAFGEVFKGTTFLHIFHNLQETYEGRLYPNPGEGALGHIHGLDPGLLMDPYWRVPIINPSRCAILCSDQWATVSKSYKQELLATSPLAPLLSRHPMPFAFQNGIPVQARLNKMKEQVGTDHYVAKRKLQQKYFGFSDLDDDIPVFAFVGRITIQKGVHLICESAEHLIHKYKGKVNILVGGPANRKEPYAARCAHDIENLARRYPNSFWAAPNEFFTDGALVNLGADFGMMPSAFEPGGIVQHEFFVGGTPVVAFKTGGLKDSVHEFNWENDQGNGFVFENYNRGDFIYAVERAIGTFMKKDKYKILRKNAFESTMDGATVTKEWCKEFYRLRGKFFADQCEAEELAKIPSEWDYAKYNDAYLDEYMYRTFISPDKEPEPGVKLEPLSELAKKQNDTKAVTFKMSTGSRRAGNVELCGTFDGWKTRHRLNYDGFTNTWYVTLHLRKGKYFYKYIVDGNWMHNDAENLAKDDMGVLNNVTVVG